MINGCVPGRRRAEEGRNFCEACFVVAQISRAGPEIETVEPGFFFDVRPKIMHPGVIAVPLPGARIVALPRWNHHGVLIRAATDRESTVRILMRMDAQGDLLNIVFTLRFTSRFASHVDR